jgi:hypothetical protein
LGKADPDLVRPRDFDGLTYVTRFFFYADLDCSLELDCDLEDDS